MEQKQRCFVIGLKGTSGSGKSTLAKALAQELGDTVILYIDKYGALPDVQRPPDFKAWVQAGADFNQWITPQLVHDIQALRRGDAITLPQQTEATYPPTFLIVEDPMGREREAMKDLLDFVVAIDIPFDIALARRIIRIPTRPYFIEHPDELGTYIPHVAQLYLDYLRDFYLALNARLHENCNLLVDGMRPTHEQVKEVARAIRTQYRT
jgi:uridine kinase